MSFNLSKFSKTSFIPREKKVRLKDLADFFEGEPDWVVRGLTGEELARVNEAAENAKNLSAIAEGLVSPAEKEKISAMRELLGITGKVPSDLVKRLEMLTLASVDPKIDKAAAVKLADTYPVEFYTLTGSIMELTGLGKQPGKPQGSGKTRQSEPPQVSAMPGEDSSSKSDPTCSGEA